MEEGIGVGKGDKTHCKTLLLQNKDKNIKGKVKKLMNISNNNVDDQPSSKSGIKADKSQGNDVESEKNDIVHNESRGLHVSLKPQMTKLCEVLLLPDNVKTMVDNFLEYVMNNHHFNMESVSMLQAFQISLIWTAASLLNHKVEHKASLTLAKQYLNFDCNQTDVDHSYSLLRCLKKIFVYRTSTYNDTSSPKASKSLNGVSCSEVVREVELFKKDLSKSIRKTQKKCEKILNKMHLMHQEEKHRLRVVNEDEKAELERKYKIQLVMTQSCSLKEVVRTQTLNILNIDHQKRIEELKCQHETRLKELEDKQSVHILKIQDWEATWVEEVKSWAKNELRNIVASKEPGTGIDYLQICDNVVESMIEAGAMVTETNSPSVSKTDELQNFLVKHDRANEMDILLSNDQLVSRSEDHNATENQYVSQEIIISKHSHSREQNSDVATSMTDEDNRCAKFDHGSQDGCERPSLSNKCLPDCENATHLEHHCSDGVSSSIPEGQILVEVQETTNEGDSICVSEIHVRVEMPVTDSFTDCLLQNATHLNLPSSVDQSDGCSIDVPVLDSVLSSKPCQAVCSTSCQDTISLSNPPLKQQISNGDIPVLVPENSHALADCHNDVEPSTNAMLVDNNATNDKEGGVLETVTNAPVPRPVNVMEPLEQGQQLPSVKSAADKDSDGEMKNSSEQVQIQNSSQDGCEMPSLSTMCLPYCENATYVSQQCSDGVLSSVPEGQILDEVEETTNEGDSMCVSDIHVRVEMPVTFNFADCLLQNATHLNPSSSMDQISDRGSIDAPVLDGVLSLKPCQADCSTSCQDKISLSNPPLKEQIPDEDIPLIVPKNCHAVADCDNGIGPSTNAMLVDNTTTNTIEPSVNVMEPLGHGRQLPSVESAADKDSDGEMQNSSEQVQLASSSSDVVPANQITVPSNQVNQLAHAELSSNLVMSGLSNIHLATEDEHQLNSIRGLSAHHSEQSSVVPNKDAGQSHSNSNLDSLPASRVRAQSAKPRIFSTPLAMNIQSTTPSSSRRLPHLSHDIEFERIQKIMEKTSKNNEDMKLQLKSDFEKELAELRRKYDVKLQEIEVEFQQTKKTMEANKNTVRVSKILADVFKSKCLDLQVSGASGMQHDSLPQQLHQLSRQQVATQPFLVSGSSSGEPPSTSLPSPSIAPNSQHMLPPGYNMSRTFSGVSGRPPLINTTRSSIAQDIQGVELRAPAPHLRSSRPSISVPPSNFNPLQRGIPSQTAPSNLRATSPSYAHVSLWQRPPSYQSDPQMGRQSDSAGRLASPNLPVTGLLGNISSQSTITSPNVISRWSDVDLANLSGFGPNSSSVVANSSHQAAFPNFVCYSEDE